MFVFYHFIRRPDEIFSKKIIRNRKYLRKFYFKQWNSGINNKKLCEEITEFSLIHTPKSSSILSINGNLLIQIFDNQSSGDGNVDCMYVLIFHRQGSCNDGAESR